MEEFDIPFIGVIGFAILVVGAIGVSMYPAASAEAKPQIAMMTRSVIFFLLLLKGARWVALLTRGVSYLR